MPKTLSTTDHQSLPKKDARIEARATAEQKAILERAAALNGQSLSDFILGNAVRAAESIIRDKLIINLSARDSALFAAAILRSAGPNEALRTAARRHDEQISS